MSGTCTITSTDASTIRVTPDGVYNLRTTYDASSNTYPTTGGSGDAGAIQKGDVWIISVAGVLGGVAVEAGDQLTAISNNPGQTSGNWFVTEKNLGYVPENSANKDASGGYAGLTGFALNIKNAAGTIISFLSSAATTARAWAMQDKDGTVAFLSDISSVTMLGGTDFSFDSTVIIPAGTGPQTIPVETLSTTPATLVEEVQSVSVTNQTLMIADAYMDGALGSTSIPAGQWEFHLWRYVSATGGATEIMPSIYTNHLEAGTITITGTGTSRTATVTGGTPFSAGDADALMEKCSWIQTPNAQMRITGYTSSSVVTVECLSTYTNESGVAFYKDTYRFNTTTGDIGEAVVTEQTIPYFLNVPITVVATDRLVCRMFAKTDSLAAKTVYFVYGGETRYSHFHSTVTARHSGLSNLAWTDSGHTGTAGNIAGFNGSGAAKNMALGTGVETALAVNVGSAGAVLTTATGAALAGSASQDFATKTLYQQGKNVPYVLDQTAYNSGILSSGSISDNGALTLTTALPSASITHGYFYYPSDAIAVGVVAGLYWTEFSDTTHGVIYNNAYTGGSLAPPASPTAFVTTGPGALTQSTGVEVTLYSCANPGGSMGALGSLRLFMEAICPGNTNTKTVFTRLGGSLIGSIGAAAVNTFGWATDQYIRNRGDQGLQAITPNASMGRSSQGGFVSAQYSHLSVDTTQNQSITFSASVNVATDYVIFTGATIEIYPSL